MNNCKFDHEAETPVNLVEHGGLFLGRSPSRIRGIHFKRSLSHLFPRLQSSA